MPQMEPFTLQSQWVSIFIVLIAMTILLAVYLLPSASRLQVARQLMTKR